MQIKKDDEGMRIMRLLGDGDLHVILDVLMMMMMMMILGDYDDDNNDDKMDMMMMMMIRWI